MSNSELWGWSEVIFNELKELECGRHIILNRCCRATLNGAIESSEYRDPILKKPYTPEINYCPECGTPLDIDIDMV